MARIPLTSGFQIIPEGIRVFRIDEVTYKEAFGKLEIKMTTADGMEHLERFSFQKSNGETNQGALNAFSYFAKTALQDYDLTDIDPNELIGFFVKCEVKHNIVPSNKDPNKTMTFIQLGDKETADGFEDDDEVPTQPSKPAPKTAAPKATAAATKKPFNLDDIL